MKPARIFGIGGICRNSRWPIAPFLALSLIAVTQTCLGDTNQIAIGVSEILHRVETATAPARSYSAKVHQTVTRTNTLASSAMFASQPSLTEEEDYVVICTTSGVVRALKGLSLKQLPQNTAITSTPSASGGSGGGGVKRPQQSTTTTSPATAPTNNVRMLIAINPINALRHIEQMHSGTIGDDVYQNTACYKIIGEDGRFGFVLWVSKSDWSVCRQIMSVDAKVLFDTQFEYKHWNGSLVPVHVVITKPSNGTRVDQQYSAHSYLSTN